MTMTIALFPYFLCLVTKLSQQLSSEEVGQLLSQRQFSRFGLCLNAPRGLLWCKGPLPLGEEKASHGKQRTNTNQ